MRFFFIRLTNFILNNFFMFTLSVTRLFNNMVAQLVMIFVLHFRYHFINYITSENRMLFERMFHGFF
ncbi:uncharacterized protein DS421_9g273440 [Arachis hypogaea]|nr:uncharacterized protein DS421_9g273440 [Arachis hypogaea]